MTRQMSAYPNPAPFWKTKINLNYCSMSADYAKLIPIWTLKLSNIGLDITWMEGRLGAPGAADESQSRALWREHVGRADGGRQRAGIPLHNRPSRVCISAENSNEKVVTLELEGHLTGSRVSSVSKTDVKELENLNSVHDSIQIGCKLSRRKDKSDCLITVAYPSSYFIWFCPRNPIKSR